MAATILVVGFVGMIQAVTLGSEMMATARRQTLAAQILEHEIGKLRLSSWATVSTLTASSTAITIDSQFENAITACGLVKDTTITLARTTTSVQPDGVNTELKEVTFTVTWNKSGTNTEATQASGSWADSLGFSGNAPIARTYTRKSVAYFGKYGLNLNIQRS